jgi:hypothetical protein
MNVEQQNVTWSDFRKSSFSGNGGCVEVAMSSAGEVLLRDSKSADSPELHFNRNEWTAFLAGVRGGEFELPH